MPTEEGRLANIEVSLMAKWQSESMVLFFDGDEVLIKPIDFSTAGLLKYKVSFVDGKPTLTIFDKPDSGEVARVYTIGLMDKGDLELITSNGRILAFHK